MKSFILSSLAASAAAAPFAFPLSNGFPNPNTTAIAEIEKQAGGSLPTDPLPTNLTPAVITAFQLVAANELFEVAYFTELHRNITNNVPGYECTEEDRNFVAGAIKRIRAQEELHALGANAILQANGVPAVGPCQYSFPVDNFQSAIKLANTFTDVVLGVLPLVQLQSATAGGPQGPGLVPLVGSIEEQEAQQTGWFRVIQQKYPSAAPFLSPTTPEFALSAVKSFLVPGTCPPAYTSLQQAIKSFPPLSVTSPPTSQKQTASYSITGSVAAGNVIAYISGQNLPVTVPISNVQSANGMTTFDASFPAETQGFADGLTVATLVSANQTFANASEVASKTLFGPGLIEYN